MRDVTGFSTRRSSDLRTWALLGLEGKVVTGMFSGAKCGARPSLKWCFFHTLPANCFGAFLGARPTSTNMNSEDAKPEIQSLRDLVYLLFLYKIEGKAG